MTDYIKHKEYKLPNGRTVTADFNELGYAMITLQAMDALGKRKGFKKHCGYHYCPWRGADMRGEV